VTDANLVLGRLLHDVPFAGEVSLDREAAERAIGALASELKLDLLACAEGIVKVAEAEMRRALAVMTVERGIDPRRFALMPFGGAGPLHAAAMADELGIERVLCPRACGVLSALGLAAAAPRRDASSTVMLSGEAFTSEPVATATRALIERARGELDGPVERVGVRYELRYRGQSFELTVEEDLDPRGGFGEGVVHSSNAPEGEHHALGSPVRLREAFEQAHEQRYGYRDEGAEVELVNVRVSVIGLRPRLRPGIAAEEQPARERKQVVFAGEWVETELWRDFPPAGTNLRGPALCATRESTLLVPPGWSGKVNEQGTVVLERIRTRQDQSGQSQANSGKSL
jgi:N-methylhydantoinase A